MNCLSTYPDVVRLNHYRRLIPKFSILLIFLIFPIFQSITYAQNPQWRVFTTANSPLPSNSVGSIVIDTNNVKWIGTDNGLVRIEGNIWTIYDTTNTPLLANGIIPGTIDKFNNLWVSVSNGLEFKGIAKFDGVNWIIYDTTNSSLPSNLVADIKTDAYNVKWIATNRGLAKFNDTTWTIYNTTNSGLPNNVTSTIAIENNVKWIGTFSLYGGMAKYNDTDWVIYNTTNSGIPGNTIRDIELDDWGIKWIGVHFGGGVGRYNSVANTWVVYNTFNSGLPDGYIICILTQKHIKWFGTQGGGLARFNDTDWVVFDPSNSPILSYTIGGLGLDSNKNLWISNIGLAIYNPAGIVGNINRPIGLPDGNELYQNYPNPFNPITTIKFSIPEFAHIVISIYDITGKKLTDLLDRVLEAGYHKVQWDGSSYSSGVYFYVLSSDKIKISKKMILIK